MKYLLVFLALLPGQALNAQTKKMKVIYVYDALCGWCYGFSPVISKLHERHQEELEFEVLSGGMVTGERIGPIGEVAGYISQAYKDVERAAGVTFGEGFLKGILAEGSAVFTSIPPAVALTVFKQHQPKKAVPFAARLQKAIYYNGIEPTNYDAYGKLAAEFGLDANAFVAQMKEEESLKMTRAEFQRAGAMGVTGFPTLFLEQDGKYTVLARGYVPLERLEAALGYRR